MNEKVRIEPWQKREAEREELIMVLLRKSFDKQEELNDSGFHMGLASLIAEYLRDRQRKAPKAKSKPGHIGLFFSSVLYEISEFSRTEIERDALVARFLEEIMKHSLSHFHADLTRQQMHQPEKVYFNSSATMETSFQA